MTRARVGRIHCARVADASPAQSLDAGLPSLRAGVPEPVAIVRQMIARGLIGPWCGRDIALPTNAAPTILHPDEWKWLPSSAACGSCVRITGGTLVRPAHVTAVEAALVGIARVFHR
ncbi:MAG TPA: hypothetical protein VK427_12500 [Kofleriaceae bacterium]|nr:hypothetical protein [Kofleriaceae bacterium]